MAYRKILLKDLFFTGPKAVEAHLQLKPGLNVLYGASNTGKSFAIKTLDFLLGSSRPLPEIQERENYERAWLSMQMPQSGSITLMRALAGGALELHEGTATVVDDKKITVGISPLGMIIRAQRTFLSFCWMNLVLVHNLLQ